MTTVHSITGRFSSSLYTFPVLQLCSFLHIRFLTRFVKSSIIQPHKKLSMDPQLRTGEVEELLHSTSFLAVLELPRYTSFNILCI